MAKAYYKTSLRKQIAGRTVVGNRVQIFATALLSMVGALLLLKSDIAAVFTCFL
jgi:hypothetical protein